MIEGLKVTIAAGELKELCKARAAYHANRAREYTAALPQLKELQDASGGSSNRPVDDAEAKIDTHKYKAAEMEFIANHLSEAETYQLDSSDLVRLGIVYSRY